MTKLALIGAGRMGGALLRGWIVGGTSPKDVLIVDPFPGEDAKAAIEQGATHVQELTKEVAKDLEILVLAIKPQMFAELAPKIADPLPEKTLVISVLAGSTQTALAEAFGRRPIVRAMPNTPAAIGQGITGYYPNDLASEADCEIAEGLLLAGGQVVRVANEGLIDVLTAVSGSGPAYVFHMVEALETAAISAGMPADLATKLARQTVVGSAALLDASSESAAQLRIAVTSPNGTTQAGLDVLMQGLTELMGGTVAAAADRSRELGKSA